MQTYSDPVLHQQSRAATTQQSIPLPNVKHSAQSNAWGEPARRDGDRRSDSSMRAPVLI